MKIGFGLIGASSIARDTMIPAIRRHAECAITSVLSSDPERGDRYARENDIPQATTQLTELLSSTAIQAVYISTTNELHHRQVLAAAQAGKHVLCEKPLAMSLAESRAMIRACRQAQLVLATNHHLRMGAGLRKMRDLVAAGVIGEPLSARVFHAVYLPVHLQNWRINNPLSGAGVVLDILVHDIDSLRFILGTEPQQVVSLSQQGHMAKADTVEDGNMAVFRFENNLIAQVHTAFTVRYAGNGIEIHGSEGSLKIDRALERTPSGPVILCNADGEQKFALEQYSVDDQTIHFFVESIKGRGQPGATGEDGERALAAALACLESARTGRRIDI